MKINLRISTRSYADGDGTIMVLFYIDNIWTDEEFFHSGFSKGEECINDYYVKKWPTKIKFTYNSSNGIYYNYLKINDTVIISSGDHLLDVPSPSTREHDVPNYSRGGISIYNIDDSDNLSLWKTIDPTKEISGFGHSLSLSKNEQLMVVGCIDHSHTTHSDTDKKINYYNKTIDFYKYTQLRVNIKELLGIWKLGLNSSVLSIQYLNTASTTRKLFFK